MFQEDEARLLLRKLLRDRRGHNSANFGVCSNCLNARAAHSTFLPELCTELFRTPLHWTVRTGNLELVRAPLNSGADATIRHRVRAPVLGEPSSIVTFHYSPLNLAIAYHMHEIVGELLKRSHSTESSKRMEIGSSMLACTTTPFSRYLIHGSSYRIALQKTIEHLRKATCELSAPDYTGKTPILVALQNNAEERYIIKALLEATPGLPDMVLHDGDNFATFIVRCAETDHNATVWKLKKMTPFVKDINAVDNAGTMLCIIAL
ncbi:hypothetical protein CC78DRAFT_363086 [Lojkania enalia]|uniref:Ankyrin repeat protein n=1 Tax=Lojkania enalia TaxID=147567 RepID=A0A9P4K2U7_9PLEO|nr:hypothetical protein CC78DRAFT_363086 [Didymosphaeria enalia]